MKKPRPFKITINGLTQYLHCDQVEDKEFARFLNWMTKAAVWRHKRSLIKKEKKNK